MKMASIQFDEVSEYGGLMTVVKEKHLAVSKGWQEVSGVYMALIGWTDTPGKRHTWLNLALEGQQNPFQLSSDQLRLWGPLSGTLAGNSLCSPKDNHWDYKCSQALGCGNWKVCPPCWARDLQVHFVLEHGWVTPLAHVSINPSPRKPKQEVPLE